MLHNTQWEWGVRIYSALPIDTKRMITSEYCKWELWVFVARPFSVENVEVEICVSRLTSIGSDNGLSLCRGQAIIWTNAEIMLIRTSGTNFSEIISGIHIFPARQFIWKCRLRNGGDFASAWMCWYTPITIPMTFVSRGIPISSTHNWIRNVLTMFNVRSSCDQLKRRIFNITPHETLRCSLILWYI